MEGHGWQESKGTGRGHVKGAYNVCLGSFGGLSQFYNKKSEAVLIQFENPDPPPEHRCHGASGCWVLSEGAGWGPPRQDARADLRAAEVSDHGARHRTARLSGKPKEATMGVEFILSRNKKI